MNIIKLFCSDAFIAVNKEMAKEIGLEAAAVFGELLSKYDHWEKEDKLNDGFFYCTIENLADSVFLSAYGQREAIKKLQERNLIEVKKVGMPAKRYIKINVDELINMINDKSLKNLTTSGENISQQVVKNFDINKNKENNNNKEEQDIKEKEIKSKKSKVFVPPTVEEVQEYCNERMNGIDPEKFVYYYQMRGWKVGKEIMKDWKAAVRMWERNEKTWQSAPTYTPQNKSQPTADELFGEVDPETEQRINQLLGGEL